MSTSPCSIQQRLRLAGLPPIDHRKELYLTLLSKKSYRSCGHFMHIKCLNGLRASRGNNTTCPLCRELVSSILPSLPKPSAKYAAEYEKMQKESRVVDPQAILVISDLYQYAMASEIAGFARSLLFRRDEVLDYLNLAYSTVLSSPSETLQQLTSIIDQYHKLMSPSPILGLVALASGMVLSALAKNPTETVNVMTMIQADLRLTLTHLYVQNTIRANFVELAKSDIPSEKDLAVLMKKLLTDYSKEHNSKQVMCKLLKQLLLVVSVFSQWDEERRNALVTQAKNEDENYFMTHVLTQVLNIKDIRSFDDIVGFAISLMESPNAISEIANWLKTMKTEGKTALTENLLINSTPLVYSLIDLPGDYEGVILKYYKTVCATCKQNHSRSAICLFCGEMLCQGSKCCVTKAGPSGNSLEELKVHLRKCGLTASAYLLLYRGTIYIQSSKLGAGPQLSAALVCSSFCFDLGTRD